MGLKEGLFVIIVICMISFVHASTVDIIVGQSYTPGESVEFTITVYDDALKKVSVPVSYTVLNYYRDRMDEDVVTSGNTMIYALPTDAVRGHWAIVATYDGIEQQAIFDVGELEYADILLEGGELIVRNVGNVPYQKTLTITIGDHPQTALVPLALGQEKRIRLTAPDGTYDVRVSDGVPEHETIFSDVALTGNVIGLERVSSGGIFGFTFVLLFLVFLAALVVVVIVLRYVYS